MGVINMKVALKLFKWRTCASLSMAVSETDGETTATASASPHPTGMSERILQLKKPCRLLNFRLHNRYSRDVCHYESILWTVAAKDSISVQLPLSARTWEHTTSFGPSPLHCSSSCNAISDATVEISAQALDNSFVTLGQVTLRCIHFDDESKAVDLFSARWAIRSRIYTFRNIVAPPSCFARVPAVPGRPVLPAIGPPKEARHGQDELVVTASSKSSTYCARH